MIRKASQLKNSAIIVGGDFNLPGWDWRTRTLKPNIQIFIISLETYLTALALHTL